MIIPVKKMTIVTLADYDKLLLEETGKLGVVHLRELTEDEFRGFREETAEEESIYNQLYEKLRMLHEKFSGGNEIQVKDKSVDITHEKIESVIEDYDRRANNLEGQIKECKEKLDELKDAKPILKVMKELKLKLRGIGEFRHILGKAGVIKTESLKVLEWQLKGRKDFIFKTAKINDEDSFIYITGLIDVKNQVDKILSATDFKEFKPPKDIPENIDKAVKWLDERKKSYSDQLYSLSEEWDDLRQDFLSKYKSLEFNSIRLRTIAHAQTNMLHSGLMTILQGWIPKDRIDTLNTYLENTKQQVEGKIAYFYEDPSPNDEIPTVMKNPKLFRAYEVLTRQYGIPDPRESDPTPISTVLWVVMFGMMFPDFGQGIVICLLGIIFTYVIKKPVVGMPMAKIGRLIIGLGISAIIFGLLMGEFFVTEVQPLWPGLQKAWITQPSNIIWIIKIAIFFGIAQIILAMSISIWNHIKQGEKIEALLSEHGLAGIITFSGIAIIAFSFLGITIVPGVEFPQLGMGVLTHPIIALPIIGLIAMFLKPVIAGEGASMGFGIVLEALISSFSNMFSYARIAGFAIAHAAFALVTVELLHANPLLGIGLGLIFLNFFSLTLEFLVVMIQALRLLYYEFSTKFYKGTGIPYTPYRL